MCVGLYKLLGAVLIRRDVLQGWTYIFDQILVWTGGEFVVEASSEYGKHRIEMIFGCRRLFNDKETSESNGIYEKCIVYMCEIRCLLIFGLGNQIFSGYKVELTH